MTSVSAPSSVHVSILGHNADHVHLSSSNGESTGAAPSPKLMTMRSYEEDNMRQATKLINMKNLVQDEKLVVATLATLQSGGPSDIIKEELKYIIQSRRVAEGKEELKVDFNPPERNELTPEELKKVEKRKEQNRLAARRFRQKRQEKNWTLVTQLEHLEDYNQHLRDELTKLTGEMQTLRRSILNHVSTCRCDAANKQILLDQMKQKSANQTFS